MFNPKHFYIPLYIYPVEALVCVGVGNKEVKRILQSRGLKEEDIELCMLTKNGETGRTAILSNNMVFIRVAKNVPAGAMLHGVIAHEVFHAATFLMDRIGCSLSIESNDAYAYLVGYITQKIYEQL